MNESNRKAGVKTRLQPQCIQHFSRELTYCVLKDFTAKKNQSIFFLFSG